MKLHTKFSMFMTEYLRIREPVVSTIITKGNAELMGQKKLAVFASNTAQNGIHPEIPAVFGELRNQSLALAGSWQSFIEKVLFKMSAPSDRANYLHYLARDLNTYRFSEHQKQLMDAGKLLVIAHEKARDRMSRRSAERRNQLMFLQMHSVLFLYIRPGGLLQRYYEVLLESGHRIFLLDIPEHRSFMCDGVVRVNSENLSEVLLL